MPIHPFQAARPTRFHRPFLAVADSKPSLRSFSKWTPSGWDPQTSASWPQSWFIDLASAKVRPACGLLAPVHIRGGRGPVSSIKAPRHGQTAWSPRDRQGRRAGAWPSASSPRRAILGALRRRMPRQAVSPRGCGTLPGLDRGLWAARLYSRTANHVFSARRSAAGMATTAPNHRGAPDTDSLIFPCPSPCPCCSFLAPDKGSSRSMPDSHGPGARSPGIPAERAAAPAPADTAGTVRGVPPVDKPW